MQGAVLTRGGRLADMRGTRSVCAFVCPCVESKCGGCVGVSVAVSSADSVLCKLLCN